MKTEEEATIEILNDLLKINNDRVEGYKKAVDEVKGYELKNIFLSMADESRQNAAQLIREIKRLGEEADYDSTTNAGKIYRTWMDVKSSFTGDDRQSVLNTCEFGEDAAQKAYDEATSSSELSSQVRHIVRSQQASLKASHDMIKNYRDGRPIRYSTTF